MPCCAIRAAPFNKSAQDYCYSSVNPRDLKVTMSSPSPLLYDTFYHIYSRGVNGEDIFVEERNYDLFVKIFGKHLTPVADLFAYCLLRNHFHLSVRIKSEEGILETRKTLTPLRGTGGFAAYILPLRRKGYSGRRSPDRAAGRGRTRPCGPHAKSLPGSGRRPVSSERLSPIQGHGAGQGSWAVIPRSKPSPAPFPGQSAGLAATGHRSA